jgi:hypothetical protein
MQYIFYLGLNGFAVAAAWLAGRSDRGYLFEGRDRGLGWLESRGKPR